MPRVQRSNVVLHVNEEDVPHYLKLGYNLTTPTGEVIKAAIPNDTGTLQKLYVDQAAQIATLENQIANLTVEVERLTAELAAKKRGRKPAANAENTDAE